MANSVSAFELVRFSDPSIAREPDYISRNNFLFSNASLSISLNL